MSVTSRMKVLLEGQGKSWMDTSYDDLDVGFLQTYARDEGLEADTLEDAIEMAAFDLGYQGVPLNAMLKRLGKKYRVDVLRSYKEGADGKGS